MGARRRHRGSPICEQLRAYTWIQTKALAHVYLKRRQPLIELAWLLAVLIWGVPRLLFPPLPSPLTPMVAGFGRVALRMRAIPHAMVQNRLIDSDTGYRDGGKVLNQN